MRALQILISLFILLTFVVAIFIYPIILLTTSDEVKDCVLKTERTGGENGKYLIFGKNEVYENTDSFIRFKFNSSDFYRDIQEGKCYTFQVQGWRIPFFSSYRNIYKIK